MRSIRLLVLATLRRRKMQTLLTALSIAVSTMALSTAIATLLSVSAPVSETFNKLRASHLLMLFDTRACDPAGVIDWWRNRDETRGVTPVMPTKSLDGGFWHNDRQVDQAVVLFERPLDGMENDQLLFLEGSETNAPGHGEVWLTNTLATSNGISLGDAIQIPTPRGIHDLTVAALVVDVNYSSGLISPTRIWVAPGDLAMIFSLGELSNAAIGVRLSSPDQIQSLWTQFVVSRGGVFSGYTLDHEIFSMSYLIVFRLLGVILLLVAGVALVLALVFISATIRNAVLSEFRWIGVLQSMGATTRSIELMYVMQFALITAIAVPIGLVGSHFVLRLVLSLMLRALGTMGAGVPLWAPFILTATLLPIAILLTAFLAARRCRHVNPAEAIRYGAPMSSRPKRFAKRLWSIPRMPVPLGLAVRSVLVNKRKALVPMLAIAFAATMATFSLNTVRSITSIGRNLALWGWDNADIEVVRGGRRFSITHEELIERLGHDRRIAGIVPRALFEGQIPARDELPSKLISGFGFLGDMDLLGVVNIVGRNPVSASEISIAVGTARDNGKKIGDPFELNLEGNTLEFTIVGIFQTIERLGQGFRVQASAVWRVDPLFEPVVYGVHLADASQAKQFIRDVERDFGEAAHATKVANLQLASVTDNMSLALFAVSGLFLMMSLVFVVDATFLSVKEEHNSFCILKTLGMTPFELRMVCVSKLLMIACVGLVLAIPSGIALTPLVFNRVMPAIGIVAFPMEIAIGPTLVLIPVVLTLTAAAAWLPAGHAKRASPRQFNLE